MNFTKKFDKKNVDRQHVRPPVQLLVEGILKAKILTDIDSQLANELNLYTQIFSCHNLLYSYKYDQIDGAMQLARNINENI